MKEQGLMFFPASGSSNAHAQSCVLATYMRFCLKFPQGIYYMSTNSKSSGEIALMHGLAWAFVGRLSDYSALSNSRWP